MTIVEEVGVMDARPAILGRPAPAGQRIGADEALNRLARSRRKWYNVCCGREATILCPVQGGL